MNTPNIIPSGYAEESEPKDAPIGNEKCSPSAGWIGEAIVNPKRFRNDANSTAGTDRSPIRLDNDCLTLDAEFSHASDFSAVD
jgi:hypothetical protein